jgi:hypothetical protein
MTTHTDPYTLELFQKYYRDLCSKAADDLYEHGVKVFNALTEDEREKFSAGQREYRLPKTILCAFAAERIDGQWNAETIKKNAKAIKRLETSRYV